MSLTAVQLEEIAELARQGKQGRLNDLVDRWGVQYLPVARAYADAQRALTSPPGTPPPPPVAPAPAAETPQEVQQEMRGKPNPNRPDGTALIQSVEALLAQKKSVKEAVAAIAAQIATPEHPITGNAIQSWYYRALDDRRTARKSKPAPIAAPAAVTAPAAADDDIFAPDAPSQPVAPPPAVTLATEHALGGDGSTEHTDPSAGLTVAQSGMLLDVPQASIAMTVTDGQVMRNPLADVTASAMPNAPRTDTPTGEQPETLGPDFMPIDELPRLMSWWDQLAPEKRRDAHERLLVQSQKAHRLLADRDAQIDRFDAAVASRDMEIEKLQAEARERSAVLETVNADRTRLREHIAKLEAEASELRAAYQGAVASYHNLYVATGNNANVASLMAENEQLQADLKAAVETIEKATHGRVLYHLVDNRPGSTPDVLTMPPGADLVAGDEWPQVISGPEGFRRVVIWHCVYSISLAAGNVMCTLRPGFAQTAEEVA